MNNKENFLNIFSKQETKDDVKYLYSLVEPFEHDLNKELSTFSNNDMKLFIDAIKPKIKSTKKLIMITQLIMKYKDFVKETSTIESNWKLLK